MPRDSPARARAAVLHVLAEAERDGSTCLPGPELRAAAGGLLAARRPTAELLREMADHGELVVEVDDDGAVWGYRAATAALEPSWPRAVARARSTRRRPAPEAAPEEPATAARRTGVVPAPEQGPAVRARVRAPALDRHRRPRHRQDGDDPHDLRRRGAAGRVDVLLVAPTGRAARRIAEATGLEASTIHAALGWIPGEGPTHDEDSRCGDLLVVDETSMANLELLVTLLRAVGPGMHVVLVGDADQLAPVGAGKPFAELVASGRVPVAALTHIFRQAAGSDDRAGRARGPPGRAPSFAPPRGCGATCS